MSLLSQFFQFKEHKTNYKTEIIGGITTFATMSYIIVVNPAILENAGIPREASVVATILTATFGTLIMGVYAKRPFAIAPYMGENAFIAYTVVIGLGQSWQIALGAIFISGVLFLILTVTKIRGWLVQAIPRGLKYSFTAGIGLFLTFIGLNVSGIIKIGTAAAPLQIGNLSNPIVLLSIFTFVIIAVMMVWRVKGAILLGMIITTLIAFLLNYLDITHIPKAEIPKEWVSFPLNHLADTFLKLDLSNMLSWGFLNVVLIVFVMAFVDTIGTLIGVSAQAGFLDEKGNLPQIEKPMLADALSTTFAALVGTTTAGAYIESASGVEAGGRTGFTAVIVAFLFLSALFFSPFFAAIPPQAYGPVLIIIGLLMLSSITKIDFHDYTESIPAFVVVILMSFTYNIGIGITGGFILYPFFKLTSGRYKEIHPGLWVLTALSILFFIFYPYT